MMSWKQKSQLLYALSGLSALAGLAICLYLLLDSPLTLPMQSDENILPSTTSKQTKPPILGPEPPSISKKERVATTSYQRMRSPLPPAPIAPIPPEPSPAEPLPFSGKLVGLLLDSDPAHRYALIQLQDARILLLGQGQALEGQNSPTLLDTIDEDFIVLRIGNRTQRLELSPR